MDYQDREHQLNVMLHQAFQERRIDIFARFHHAISIFKENLQTLINYDDLEVNLICLDKTHEKEMIAGDIGYYLYRDQGFYLGDMSSGIEYVCRNDRNHLYVFEERDHYQDHDLVSFKLCYQGDDTEKLCKIFRDILNDVHDEIAGDAA